MKEESTTIDNLAIMVKNGFDEVHKRFDQMATKEDLNDLKIDMDNQFSEVNRRLDNHRTSYCGRTLHRHFSGVCL